MSDLVFRRRDGWIEVGLPGVDIAELWDALRAGDQRGALDELMASEDEETVRIAEIGTEVFAIQQPDGLLGELDRAWVKVPKHLVSRGIVGRGMIGS